MQRINAELDTRGVHPFDRISVSGTDSVGIDEIRSFQRSLSLSATHGTRAGIIPDGSLLTESAQQALLKTLEEPPSDCLLYIGVGSQYALLPTILSRCQIENIQTSPALSGTEWSAVMDVITHVLSLSPGKRIAELARRCPTKDDAVRFTDDAIHAIRQTVLTAFTHSGTSPDPRHMRLLGLLLLSRKFRPNNVSPVLLLEHAFLNLDNQNTNGYNGL